jgi:hypothetical protein
MMDKPDLEWLRWAWRAVWIMPATLLYVASLGPLHAACHHGLLSEQKLESYSGPFDCVSGAFPLLGNAIQEYNLFWREL